MLKKIALGLCLVTVSAGVMFSVTAKSKPSLVSDMQAYMVKTNAQGQEYRQPAKMTEPGSVLEYNLSYTNQMDKSLSGLIVSGPIPANTMYIGSSAKAGVDADLVVSIDGGASFESEPVRRQKRMADGKMATVIIPAEKYTNIRWKVKQPIPGFGKQLYSYRVKVK